MKNKIKRKYYVYLCTLIFVAIGFLFILYKDKLTNLAGVSSHPNYEFQRSDFIKPAGWSQPDGVRPIFVSFLDRQAMPDGFAP
jgi:hypothetical protein